MSLSDVRHESFEYCGTLVAVADDRRVPGLITACECVMSGSPSRGFLQSRMTVNGR